MTRWMVRWMDGRWLDEWVDGQKAKNGWMKEFMDWLYAKWIYGCLNGWLDEWVNGRLDGPMDISSLDEWEDGWMDDHEQTKKVSMHV